MGFHCRPIVLILFAFNMLRRVGQFGSKKFQVGKAAFGGAGSPLILGEKTRLGIWKRSKTLEKVEKVKRILEKGVKWRWN